MAKKIKKGYETIEIWSKKLGKPTDDIIAEIEEYKVKIKKEHPKISDDEARDHAIGRFFASQKKHLTDIGTDKIVIKILCNTGPFNWVASKKAVALSEYDKDPDVAVRDGFVRLIYNDLNEVVD
ncbi:hypothetical protein LCGC14_1123260, partial [marine sediment metagenome]